MIYLIGICYKAEGDRRGRRWGGERYEGERDGGRKEMGKGKTWGVESEKRKV